MSYDVSFKVKLEGAEQWVYVGDSWINHTSNTAAMIKDACGSYPSEWNGKSSADLIPVLENGIAEIQKHSKKYKQFEPENGWGTIESTLEFLKSILKNCKLYPASVLEVDY